MPNFLDTVNGGTQPGVFQSKPSNVMTIDKLRALGTNTQQIDQQVEQEAQNQQANSRTQQQFKEAFANAKASGKFEDVSDKELFQKMLQGYQSKGLTIEGIDIDKELGLSQPTPTIAEKEPGGLQETVKGIYEASPLKVIRDFRSGGLAQVPEILGNIAGFVADVATFDEVGEDLKNLGVTGKQGLQDLLGTDPEAFATKTGEFGVEVGSLFVPGGQATLALKFPKAAEKIGKIGQALNTIGQKQPALYNTLKAAATGIKEMSKFGVVSEGEITKGDVLTGAGFGVAGLGLSKLLSTPTGKEAVKAIHDRFGKLATKLSPSRTTKAITDKEIKTGTEGAFIIREMNKDMKLAGDEAVGNALTASQNTRKELLKAIEKEQGVGGISVNPVVTWIDDIKLALTQRGYQKKLPKETKEQFDYLSRLDSKQVIKTLENLKKELLSPAKSKAGNMSLGKLDDFIIYNNSQIGTLFNKATKVSEQQALQTRGAVNSQLIKLLDSGVQGSGPAFRALKHQYGKVRTFENNLDKIYAQVLRRKDSQLGDYADTFILSNLATSIATQDVTAIGKATLQKLIKEQVKKQNDPNFVVENMFKLIDKQLGIKPTTTLGKIRSGVDEGAGKLGDILTGKTPQSKATPQQLQGLNKVSTTANAEVKELTKRIKDSVDDKIGFHGTNAEFDKFLAEKIGSGASSKFGEGVYLSSSPKVAETYADLMSGLKGGKPRLLEIALPDTMKMKAYDGPMTGLKEASAAAKKEGYKGIKFNATDDFIQIPGLRKVDTTGHSNYLIFNPADAKIIKNELVNKLGIVKGLGLMRDLLGVSIVGLSAVEIGSMIHDKYGDKEVDTFPQQVDTTPRG